jgi:hypothetical protein
VPGEAIIERSAKLIEVGLDFRLRGDWVARWRPVEP